MQILLATSNKGKVQEMREALDGLSLDLLSLADVPTVGQPEETGSTYEENAIQKANYYANHSGLPSVADDSGIHIDALEGELGIHTRRWGAGPQATDKEWIEFFLDRMRHEKIKRAEFVCVIAYLDAQKKLHTFRGECLGVITPDLESEYLPGLPISACFKPDGFSKVFSALTLEEKNAVSHRGQALGKLREFLQQTI